MRYNLGAHSFYIMKLCSRLVVLHCRSRPKYDNSRHFDPHFEEVRGGVEPWWMVRLESPCRVLAKRNCTFFLSLTVAALQGKTCQNSQPSGVGRSLGAKISGEGVEKVKTRMWANAQPDGHPAEHRWRPLFNAAKFG